MSSKDESANSFIARIVLSLAASLGISWFVIMVAIVLMPLLVVSLLLLSLLGILGPLGHDVFKLRPQRLDGGELVADGDDGLEGSVQLVDVGEDVFEALETRAGVYQ